MFAKWKYSSAVYCTASVVVFTRADYLYEGLFVDTLARCIYAGLRLKILDTFHSFLDRFEGTCCAIGTRV